MISASARTIVPVASANEQSVGLHLEAGWYMVTCADAWITLVQRDSRVGLDASGEIVRTWRMGPASRTLVQVVEKTRLTFVTAAVLTTRTVDATTGLQSISAAAPLVTVSDYSREDAQDTRSGWTATNTASPLTSRAQLQAGAPIIFYVPGFARRGQIRCDQAVMVLEAFDGPTQTAFGVLNAGTQLLDFHAVDPWAGYQLSIAAVAGNVMCGWVDL